MDCPENFSEEELLLNESFHNWVKNNNLADINYWEGWLARYPEKSMLVQNARNIILSLSPEERHIPANEVAAAWVELQQRLKQRKLPDKHQKNSSYPAFKKWYAIAAVFLGLCMSGFVIWHWLMTDKLTEYATNFGETKALVLPDGSEVMLNGNTQIRYKETWTGRNNREVWLAGEAYFSVRKFAGQPEIKFIVHTAKLDVEVLGTQFNVSDRKNATQVVLNEGQVKVRTKKDTYAAPMILKPGELLKFCNTQQTVIKKVVNPHMYSSWKFRKMVFEETTIEELAERIEATYGYKVVFADRTVAMRKLTGTIPSDNIDVLLLTLSKLFDLDVRKDKNNIFIKSNY